jgi:hypothetical protein
MKQQNFLLLVVPMLCGTVMAGCGGADVTSAPFPKICYTASYESVDKNFTRPRQKISSDGIGHILVCHGGLNVEDYVRNSIALQGSPYNPDLENQSLLMGRYMGGGQLVDEKLYLWSDAMRRQGWSLLDKWWAIMHDDKLVPNGEKVVDGHNCRGWVFASNYAPLGPERDELWFDKDSGVLVREDTTKRLFPGGPVSSESLRLKNFSKIAMPPEAFILPIRDPKLWTQVTGIVAKSTWAPDDPRSNPLTYTDAKLKDYIEEKPAPKEPSAHTRPVGQTPTHTSN